MVGVLLVQPSFPFCSCTLPWFGSIMHRCARRRHMDLSTVVLKDFFPLMHLVICLHWDKHPSVPLCPSFSMPLLAPEPCASLSLPVQHAIAVHLSPV